MGTVNSPKTRNLGRLSRSDFQFKQPLFKSVGVVLKKKVSIVFAVCRMGGGRQ